MYICICQAVTDKAIHHAVDKGARNLSELQAITGCGTQCGSCIERAEQVLDERLESIEITRGALELQAVPSI
jgi:bacterioferritin-associated ferredoxin